MSLDVLVNELETCFEEKDRIHLDHFEQVDEDRYNLSFAFDDREDLDFDIKEERDGYMIQTSIPFWFTGEMKNMETQSEWFMQKSAPFGSPDITTNGLKKGYNIQQEVAHLINTYVSTSHSLQQNGKQHSYE